MANAWLDGDEGRVLSGARPAAACGGPYSPGPLRDSGPEVVAGTTPAMRDGHWG